MAKTLKRKNRILLWIIGSLGLLMIGLGFIFSNKAYDRLLQNGKCFLIQDNVRRVFDRIDRLEDFKFNCVYFISNNQDFPIISELYKLCMENKKFESNSKRIDGVDYLVDDWGTPYFFTVNFSFQYAQKHGEDLDTLLLRKEYSYVAHYRHYKHSYLEKGYIDVDAIDGKILVYKKFENSYLMSFEIESILVISAGKDGCISNLIPYDVKSDVFDSRQELEASLNDLDYDNDNYYSHCPETLKNLTKVSEFFFEKIF